MNIIYDNILIRAIETRDNELLLNLINDQAIENFVGGWSFPVSSVAQQKWFDNLKSDNTCMRCVICVNDVDTVGAISLSDIDWKNRTAQIHIKILSKYHNKGYSTKAVKAITKYCFEQLGLNCIYSLILSYNSPSIKLFEKCGFVTEGILKSRIYKNGKFNDIISMSYINDKN